MNSSKQSLIASGLSASQATVYEKLLELSTAKAGQIAKLTSMGRGLVYKVLDELSDLDLIKKDESSKVTRFTVHHPIALRTLSQKRQQQAQDAQVAIDSVLGSLISSYNLSQGKPGVEFFEGIDGINTILEDTLTSSEEIYMYADIDSINASVSKINAIYTQKRLKSTIKKKLLVLDTPSARTVAKKERNPLTDFRIIKRQDTPTTFSAVMQIYDNKISYITFNNNLLTGTIIHDPAIYQMHRYLFESLWDQSRALL